MDRKSRFVYKYIRKLAALVFNGIQRSSSKSASSWCPSSDEEIYFYGFRLGIILTRHSHNLSASLLKELGSYNRKLFLCPSQK